ncbi:hypothetical protein M5689_003592 [Euphorbia peplus]|nr:hypothetical protein M5689_003592 [Euphorbia peplus]
MRGYKTILHAPFVDKNQCEDQHMWVDVADCHDPQSGVKTVQDDESERPWFGVVVPIGGEEADVSGSLDDGATGEPDGVAQADINVAR